MRFYRVRRVRVVRVVLVVIVAPPLPDFVAPRSGWYEVSLPPQTWTARPYRPWTAEVI
jgi:hypothetical protein